MSCCEYAKLLSGLGESEFIRECKCADRSTCPKSIFSNPLIYESCPVRLQYQKDGEPNLTQEIEPAKAKIIPVKRVPIPKYTNIACTGCQYKDSSYCYLQCSYNVWKRQPNW